MRASFQLVPEGRYDIPPGVLDEIRRRGFEVNVHDLNHDGRLFTDRDEFRRRALRINAYAREFGARGFRSGVLYRRPEWYDALEIAYDMSVPNVGHLEVQRGGCCTVMPYFIGRIVELPLDDDPGLFPVPRAPRLLQRGLAPAAERGHGASRPGELPRPSRTTSSPPGPGTHTAPGSSTWPASGRRGGAGSPCPARWSAGGGRGAG